MLKYSRFFTKMITTNPPLVCPLCFLVIFAVLGFLCHHCSSLHKTESRQHTRNLTIVNSEAVCIQKIHPIGFFSPTVKALWLLHPHKCLFFKNPRALHWKWAFSTADSTIASFYGTLWYRESIRLLKKLGPKVKNIRTTQGGKVNLSTDRDNRARQ